MIKGKVSRTTDFGAFVELAEGIEGLCHVSEIEERKSKGERDKEKAARGARVTAVLAVGKEYEFKVLRLEPEQHKISLSFEPRKNSLNDKTWRLSGQQNPLPMLRLGMRSWPSGNRPSSAIRDYGKFFAAPRPPRLKRPFKMDSCSERRLSTDG